ncbi:MAG: DNA-directed RNA polymerase subunit omega [Verrucomicrobiales bacterium]|nr:DNA-directed RNA polymerase subunit omega [Verrucomicrobiales bacterium]
MNSELTRAALEKVGNPNILVNLVSRRVRQLNAGGGAGGRPLVEGAHHLGAADVALREIIEDKLTYEQVPSLAEELVPTRKRRRH